MTDNKYKFQPSVEQAIVGCLISSSTFWAKLGVDMDLGKLPSAVAVAVAGATLELFEEHGEAPGELVVLQKLYDAYDEKGNMSVETLTQLETYITEACACVPDKLDVLIKAASKVVRKEERVRVSEQVFEALASNDSLSDVAKKIQHVETIGLKASIGSLTDEGEDMGFGHFEALGKEEYCPLGFPNIDEAMGGGPTRGTFNLLLGPQKSGKSMVLSQAAVQGVYQNLFVAVVPLEIASIAWMQRMYGGLMGVPYKEVSRHKETYRRLKASAFPNGDFSIMKRDASSGDVSVEMIFAWVAEIEKKKGRKVDSLVIDYLDRVQILNVDGTINHKIGTYEGQNVICKALLNWAQGLDNEGTHQRWVHSASQTKRLEKKVLPQAGDVADSINKVRVASTTFGLLNMQEDNTVSANVIESREGPFVGAADLELPCGFDLGVFAKTGSPPAAVHHALVTGGDAIGDVL
jgi:hypothetical protein